MFRELFKAFGRRDTIQELLDRIGEMLDAGRWMFNQAAECLTQKVDWADRADPLYERDREINRLEQDIRRTIITHLTVGRNEDLLACLAIMSVVKDAERIGDYCKNIFEVGRFYEEPFQHPEFARPLEEIRQAADALFEPCKHAIVHTDADKAKEVMRTARDLSQQCELLIRQLLQTDRDDFAAGEAVAYVLLSRHFKRIVSHLSNVATSVVAPVPRLDFLDEKKTP